MITEDYVSKEIYNLLKDKGYNGKFEPCYGIEGYIYLFIHLYDAMKWLREVHNVIIMIDYYTDGDIEPDKRYGFSVFARPHYTVSPETYSTYEEAAEAAIKDCLENSI